MKIYIYYQQKNPKFITAYAWDGENSIRHYLGRVSPGCYANDKIQVDIDRKTLWHKLLGEKVTCDLIPPRREKPHCQWETTERITEVTAWGEAW